MWHHVAFLTALIAGLVQAGAGSLPKFHEVTKLQVGVKVSTMTRAGLDSQLM